MDMIIISCLGLLDSNYQLRHLKHLYLNGCSKVAEFLKTVEDTRQSMPAVVSIEESPISSVPELLQLSPPTNTTNSNDGCSSILLPKLPTLNLKKCALSKSNFFRTFDCCSTLTFLDLSRSDIVTLPPCIRRFVRLKSLYLMECKQLKEILGLPPNVQQVDASGCVSLAIFLEEGRRSQLLNTPEALFQVGTVFPELILGNHGLTESDFLIQRDCPSSLTSLNLSGSAIVSLPAWLNKFVGLEYLSLNGCKQLEEIPELPSTLKWIDLSDCHGLRDNMGDALQIRLMSEVPLFHIYMGMLCKFVCVCLDL
jgi:Leucine-rich repeat (LRR) protein